MKKTMYTNLKKMVTEIGICELNPNQMISMNHKKRAKTRPNRKVAYRVEFYIVDSTQQAGNGEQHPPSYETSNHKNSKEYKSTGAEKNSGAFKFKWRKRSEWYESQLISKADCTSSNSEDLHRVTWSQGHPYKSQTLKTLQAAPRWNWLVFLIINSYYPKILIRNY